MSDLAFQHLAEITSNGFTAKKLPEIRDALAGMFKEVYGSDIDISNASADGQYIYNEALIFNNIYRTLESIAMQMNPNTATGKYLDMLAGFTNTRRKAPTYSTVPVKIKTTSATSTPERIQLLDNFGTIWTWVNPIDFNGAPQITIGTTDTILEFTCEQIGPVQPGNGTWTFVDGSQATTFATPVPVLADAVVGESLESDASLRRRRLSGASVRGETVQDALKSKLLSISGVEDVAVFNQVTDSPSKTMDDTAVVPYHNVYVCVRQTGVPDYTIGSTIYTALTPGVSTDFDDDPGNTGEPTITGGVKKSTAFTIYEVNGLPQNTTVCWKNCQPDNRAFTITGTALAGDLTNTQKDAIKQVIISDLNNRKITETFTTAELLAEINAVDFKSPLTGAPTYMVTAMKAGSSSIANISMDLSYFNYIPDDITIEISSGTLTITIAAGA